MPMGDRAHASTASVAPSMSAAETGAWVAGLRCLGHQRQPAPSWAGTPIASPLADPARSGHASAPHLARVAGRPRAFPCRALRGCRWTMAGAAGPARPVSNHHDRSGPIRTERGSGVGSLPANIESRRRLFHAGGRLPDAHRVPAGSEMTSKLRADRWFPCRQWSRRVAAVGVAFAGAFVVDHATQQRFSSVWGSLALVASALALAPRLRGPALPVGSGPALGSASTSSGRLPIASPGRRRRWISCLTSRNGSS